MLIVHATEHLDETDSGFLHAVALAAAHSGGTELVTLHVRHGQSEPETAPSAASLLDRWKLSPRPDIRQRVCESQGHDDIADELITACERLEPDLIILPTHARTGVLRWLVGSTAEAIARNVRKPCLLLPLGSPGIVDAGSGALDLKRLLVLGGEAVDAQLGLEAAAWLVHAADQSNAELTLLHVDDGTPAPFRAPEGVRVRVERQRGQFEEVASKFADQARASVLVMVSHGHDELRDVFWSSHTERVLHTAKRPVLWVPSGKRAQ